MLIHPELHQAQVRELCSGRQFLDLLQGSREKLAAEVAAESRRHKPKSPHGLRHVAEIPQREYFQLINKYGIECFDDKGFLKDFQRLEPTMAVHKI